MKLRRSAWKEAFHAVKHDAALRGLAVSIYPRRGTDSIFLSGLAHDRLEEMGVVLNRKDEDTLLWALNVEVKKQECAA